MCGMWQPNACDPASTVVTPTGKATVPQRRVTPVPAGQTLHVEPEQALPRQQGGPPWHSVRSHDDGACRDVLVAHDNRAKRAYMLRCLGSAHTPRPLRNAVDVLEQLPVFVLCRSVLPPELLDRVHGWTQDAGVAKYVSFICVSTVLSGHMIHMHSTH